MKITRTHSIKIKYLAMIYQALLYVVFAVFELIDYPHYKQTWNGKFQLLNRVFQSRKANLISIFNRLNEQI